MDEFSRYGPIQSIKILWPRQEEEKRRTRLCGFVAFNDRVSAEKAKEDMQSVEICGVAIRISWGKAVKGSHAPSHTSQGPSHSSHVTPVKKEESKAPLLTTPSVPVPTAPMPPIHPSLLQNMISVVIPTDPKVKHVIDQTATFVAKDGIVFEKYLRMDNQNQSQQFNFLWEEGSALNQYYKWRTYSLLQGDTLYQWRSLPFQMYQQGPLWQPPPPLAEESEKVDADAPKPKSKLEKLKEDMDSALQHLTIERKSIRDAMAYALEHADSSAEVVRMISESMHQKEAAVSGKVARLYLVSDILYNSSAPVPNASSYRNRFEEKLPDMFSHLGEVYRNTGGRMTAQNLKEQVLRVLRVWEGWSLYPQPYLTQLNQSFSSATEAPQPAQDEDVDGVPLEM
eukprot:TRINITY_DN3248_c0_g3_i5.p1 TRINITY_DN3248_c0_g3~~TRINITY_DN3248_c0_g3_i5.p1  ORF type:complete len:396 (+),score=100.47 TRINITY_DN3248_c0_g3_i5:694-1881(+)